MSFSGGNRCATEPAMAKRAEAATVDNNMSLNENYITPNSKQQ
jgi:hypothetical protein